MKAKRYTVVADQFLVWNKITVDGEKVVSEGLRIAARRNAHCFSRKYESAVLVRRS